jgi:hypothetical protein
MFERGLCMYYFLYRTDYLSKQLRNQLVQSIETLVNEDRCSFFISKMTHYFLISYRNKEVSLTLSDQQVLVGSPTDFENGCDFTDYLINHILYQLGSIYTLIE